MASKQIEYIKELARAFKKAQPERGLISMIAELRDEIVTELEDIVKEWTDMEIINLKENDIVIIRVDSQCLLNKEQKDKIEEHWNSIFKAQGYRNVKAIVTSKDGVQIEKITYE